jgi:uncharacterized protein YPO0396
MNAQDLVASILYRDATGISKAFNEIMVEKISTRLDMKREELSRDMFNQHDYVDEEFELEEARKKWKKMCEDLTELSEDELAEAKKKFKKVCEELTEEEISQIDEKQLAKAMKKAKAC